MKLDLNLTIASSESTEDWVKQSRELEKQKLIAQQQARKLQEEEEQNVNELSSNNRKIRFQSNYTSNDLRGLKIRHDTHAFDTEGDIILTLADTDVLATDQYGRVTGLNDEDDDILENVNIAEHERKIQRDKQLKRLKQPLYKGYDDDEFETGRIGVKQEILPHYEDEEMRKKRQRLEAKIVLGADGTVELATSTGLPSAQQQSNKQLTSLETESKIATSFFTADEIKFRKKKNGDKKKRHTRVKVDDEDEEKATAYPPTAAGGEVEYDLADILGSEEPPAPESQATIATNDISKVVPSKPSVSSSSTIKRQQVIPRSVVFEDEDEDFANAMKRARESALKNRVILEKEGMSFNDDDDEQEKPGSTIIDAGAQRALQLLTHAESKEPDQDEEVDVDGRRADGTMVFNSTMQFSSRLQAVLNERARDSAELALRDISMNAAQSTLSLTGLAANAEDSQKQKNESEHAEDGEYSWDEFDDAAMDDDDDEGSPSEDEQMAFLHRQPLVAKGMAATLELLKGSGELNQGTKLAGRAKDSRAIDPSQMIDDNVKLEYRDEFGRKLTQKEAFRQLSYKFHGYGPGRKKLEKRMKQREMEIKAQKVRSGVLEGAAGTMRTLTKTQEATGKAHLVVPVGTSVLSKKQ